MELLEVIEQVSIQLACSSFSTKGGSWFCHKNCIVSYIFMNPLEKKAPLEVELAAIMDWGRLFVTAIYSLEGMTFWH